MGRDNLIAMKSRIIALLGLLLIAYGCESKGPQPNPRVHQLSPAFSLTTLDGQKVSMADLHGKVVVLDFWATWCSPCRQSLPHLQSMASNSDLTLRGLSVFAVNEREKPAAIDPFMEQNHYTFRVVDDPQGSLADDFGVEALPTTIVIGRDGVVEAVITGSTPENTQLIDQAVELALEAPVR
jgi:peroxiredoxin